MSLTVVVGPLTITSASAPLLTILEHPQMSIHDTLDQRSTASFSVLDLLGNTSPTPIHFAFGMQVTITDSVAGLLFSGYVNDATETNYPPNAAIQHDITCIDQHYLADKRVASGLNDDLYMSNRFAGDVATYLLANYLSAEGVTASYAQASANRQTDFATGILSNAVAASNVGEGDLELASAGVAVSKVDTTTANFQSSTSLTGIDTANNQLALASHPGLQYTGYASPGYNNAYAYTAFWTGSYTIQATDYLSYKVWINSKSPKLECAVDGTFSDGTTIRDAGLLDQFALSAHPSADLSGYANDQWFSRFISLSSLAGKSLVQAQIGMEGESSGQYTAYFYDIAITDSSGTGRKVLYASLGGTHGTVVQPSVNAALSANGYSNVKLTPMVVYEQNGTRVGVLNSLTAVGIYRDSFIGWTQTVPPNTTLSVYTSIDDGASFQPASLYQVIPNFQPGTSLIGRNLQTRQVLSLAGTDPTVTPVLADQTWNVMPSYVATKTDTFKAYHSQANWNTGTLSNLTTSSGGDLLLISSLRNWDDGAITNQTLFGSTGTSAPVHNNTQRHCNVACDATCFANSRLDFAGNWLNFTLTCDIQVIASCNTGIVYRTTNWDTTPNSFGWAVEVSTTQLKIGYGSNTASTNSYTNIGTFSFPNALTAGDTHTLKVVVNGTSHQAYLDNTLYANITSTVYSSVSGPPALRYFNGGSNRNNAFFDNFGIMSILSTVGSGNAPSWTSPTISVGSLTVGSSLVSWGTDGLAGDQVFVLASLNGGSYQACTNNAPLPQLAAGQILTNATVKFLVTLQAATAAETPLFHGLSFWLSSQYVSTGNRVSPGLLLTPVGRAGSTLVAWNGVQPSGTTIAVDTSLDTANNWITVGSGATGNAPIAGITTQPDPMDDTFESNTSSYYTSTIGTGGTPATWTWGPTNVTAVGGTEAQLLYSGVNVTDVDLTVDMDTSDNGGLVWRVVNSNFFYLLVITDASSPTPNTATLYRVQNAVYGGLTPSATINWVRGSVHRIRVTMLGGQITVYFDGAQILQYTDPFPLAGGLCGLRSSTVSGASMANFYFFRLSPLGAAVTGRMVFTRVRLTSTDATVTPQLSAITTSVRSPDIGNGVYIPSVTYSVRNGSQNTLAQDFDDLAKQSNYWWRIRNKRFSFQAHTGTLAPFALSSPDFFTGAGITVKRTGDFFRTMPWILGGTDTVVASRSFVCDGLTRTFTLDYPVQSLVSVSDGVRGYTFGVKGVDTGRDFYYQVGNNTINQDASETPLNPGVTLTFVENGIINVVATAQNASLIATQATLEQTSGLIEVPETAPGLNAAAATQLASARLTQYSVPALTFTGTTARVGLAVGQLTPFFVAEHGLIDQPMLLTDIQTQFRTDGWRGVMDATPYFTLTAVSGPILNSWSATLAGLGR